MSKQQKIYSPGVGFTPDFHLPTGSLLLNKLLTEGGIASGSAMQIGASSASAFKTSHLIQMAAMAQRGEVIWSPHIKEKYDIKVAYIDAEGAVDNFIVYDEVTLEPKLSNPWFEGMGLDPNKTYFIDADKGEVLWEAIKDLIEYNGVKFVIMDSIHACLSLDTEILTPSGWKYYDEISTNDIVGTYNNETNTIEFQHVMEKIVKNEPDNLISIKHKGIDLLVTKDHRLLHRSATTKDTKVYKTSTAEDLYGKKAYIPASGLLVSENEPYDNNLVALGVFCVADGHYSYRNKKLHHIEISVKKQRKIDLLKSILAKTDIEYTDRYTSNGYYKVIIYSDYATKLNEIFTDKELKWEVLNWSNQLRETILDTYLKTDGSIRNGTHTYITTNLTNAEIIQAIGCTLNRIMTITKVEAKRNRKACYYVFETKNSERLVNKNNYSTIPYNGDVWCVTVPNSYIVVRRNGMITIVGNCQPTSVHESEAGDNLVMAHAKLHTTELVKILPILRNNNAILAAVNHKKVNMTAMGSRGEKYGGGKAWELYSKYIFTHKLAKAKSQLDDMEYIPLDITVEKSKGGKSFNTIQTFVTQSLGIRQEAELINIALEAKLIRKAGGWYKDSEGTAISNGIKQPLLDWCMEHKSEILEHGSSLFTKEPIPED